MDTPDSGKAHQTQAQSPLSLEFWPEPQALGLDAMNASLDWLGELGHGQAGSATPQAPPGAGSNGGLAGLPHGGGGSSTQLHHQQLLASSLQPLHPMLPLDPSASNPVRCGHRCSTACLPRLLPPLPAPCTLPALLRARARGACAVPGLPGRQQTSKLVGAR